MKVLCRCHNSSQERPKNVDPPYRVGDYTDLEALVVKGRTHFISNNLIEDRNNGRYKNRNTNWDRFYSSRLTVPIRHQGKSSINISGVITIDSKDLVFKEPERSYCINISKCFADVLYNFFFIVSELEESITRPGSNAPGPAPHN